MPQAAGQFAPQVSGCRGGTCPTACRRLWRPGPRRGGGPGQQRHPGRRHAPGRRSLCAAGVELQLRLLAVRGVGSARLPAARR
eukprot:708159-Heterocapsa_arctica.AAC.1